MSTVDDFRRSALSLPGAVESRHMGRPDFRANGKIFATLGSDGALRGVVKLTLDHQEMLCAAEPGVFSAVKGGWGAKGWTEVDIMAADKATLVGALRTAWRIVAPKRAVAAFDAGSA